jgi:hypothetical protein
MSAVRRWRTGREHKEITSHVCPHSVEAEELFRRKERFSHQACEQPCGRSNLHKLLKFVLSILRIDSNENSI